MSLDIDEGTARSVVSPDSSDDSTGSSARLDEALRQAARQAGTQALESEENGEMSMEMAGDEVTNAFKPWMAQQQAAQPSFAEQDQEDMDPFSSRTRTPATARIAQPQTSLPTNGDDETSMDMTMTRAVGGIIPAVGVIPATSSETNMSSEGGTMDLTMVMPGSGIVSGATSAPADNDRRASLKRRRSSVLNATTGDETGSPAKKQAPSRRTSIRASRRRSSVMSQEEAGSDETMDLTATLGMIQEDPSQQLLQEQEDQKENQVGTRPEVAGRESMDTSFGEEPMDMTIIVGSGITGGAAEQGPNPEDTNENLSMEFTTALGTIQQPAASDEAPATTTTPVKTIAEAQKQAWGFPFEEVKPLSPDVQITRKEVSPGKKTTPQKSPKRTTPRKSIIPATPEAQTSAKKTQTPLDKPPSSRSRSKRASLVQSASPAKVADTPIAAAPESNATLVTPVQIQEPQVETPVAQGSPTPKANPQQPLPPPVRSPLGPKGDGSGNEMPAPPKLSDSIKQLATPRKQLSNSPLKKVIAASTPRAATKGPKKDTTSARTRRTRKSTSPVKKSVKVAEDVENLPPEDMAVDSNVEQQADEERVPLQDFLNMTGIQFLDLQTTKRRHTGFPNLKISAALLADEDDAAGGDGSDSLERTVVAATTLVPELSMFQHSCHEMKSYLSTGKDVVRTIEAEVLEEQPQLFREYMSAPPKERQIMDDQFRAMKAHARLESKGTWYQWRSQLLRDLAGGLGETEAGMEEDEKILVNLENNMTSTLRELRERSERLESEAVELRRKKAERESGEREELDEARQRLTALDSDLEEKKRMIESLRSELTETDATVETVRERKDECIAAIREAQRVTEECRGWTAQEVSALKAQVKDMETAHNWTVLSATSDPATITLSYRNELELFFHPFAFKDARSTASSPSKPSHSNAPVSLIYNAKKGTEEPSTAQRFFLQLLRANLLALPQSTTSISTLLKLVSKGWEKCRAVTEAVRQLELLGMCDISILGDEMLNISVVVLLPQVETKVNVAFQLAVTVGAASDQVIGTRVQPVVKVVYGERYDEPKMGEFLKTMAGEELLSVESMGVWYEAVADLRARLIKRGRKG